jgi:ribosomal protein S18 acetylase RimI-like enzyme
VTVVPFEPEFLPGVLRLCEAEGWPTYPDDPDLAMQTFLDEGTLTLVALTEQEEVAGFVHALADPTRMYICELAVDPAHRRQGLARALVEGLFRRVPDLPRARDLSYFSPCEMNSA